MRVGVYYVPEARDPLWRAGCAWLGRNPEGGPTPWQPAMREPALREMEAVTADARRYGFHATLKPPMRLATSWNEIVDDARQVAQGIAPFPLPRLAVADLSGFLALRETAPCPPLQALADLWVAALDRHRAPADVAERARRRPHDLSSSRAAMLDRWGYPDVFATWRFHMTLTRRLTQEEEGAYRPAAEAHFAASLDAPRQVAEVALFVETEAGGNFTLIERLRLTG